MLIQPLLKVCTVGEAKAIYPLMGIAANVALVAAGNFMKAVNLALPVRCFTPFPGCYEDFHASA